MYQVTEYSIISKSPFLIFSSKQEIITLFQEIVPLLKQGKKFFYHERGEPLTFQHIENLQTLHSLLLWENIDIGQIVIISENFSSSYKKFIEKLGFKYVFCPFWLVFMADTVFRKEHDFSIKEKKFLFLNKEHKPHRTHLINFLNSENLLNDCYYSIVWDNKKNFLENPSENLNDNWTYHEHLLHLYKSTCVNIITDTIFKDVIDETGEWYWYTRNGFTTGIEHSFFSQKIFRQFLIPQPFIIVASRNTLRGLRDLGFRTFSSLIDETYDELSVNDRILAIEKELIKLGRRTIEELQDLTSQCKDIFLHNKNQLFILQQDIMKNFENEYPMNYPEIREHLFMWSPKS